MFCGFEAELVVPVESCSTDCEGGVSKCEAGVGEGMGLGEVEGVQVGGNGVVGGVLKIWDSSQFAFLTEDISGFGV
jgi:hypothetical protein